MQNIIKSGFKYFVFIGFFGVCINLIYLSIPVYMMIVYDRVLFSYSKATLYTLGVGVLVSLAVLGLIDYFRMRMLEQAGNNIAQKMMPFVMKNMQKNAATKGMNPQVYSRGIYDLEILRDAVVSGHIFYILDLPWVLIFLGVLYLMHPLVGGIAIAGVGIVFLFQLLLRALEKKRYIIADTAFHNNADFAHTCLQHGELISGMGMQSAVMEKYENRYTKNLTTKAGADIFQSGMGTMIRLFHLVSMAAVFGAGSFVFFTDEITLGVILASVIVITRVFYPFDKSLSHMKISIEAVAAYKRLKQFVDTREEKKKLPLPAPTGKFDVQGISLVIHKKTILHNISLALEPGERLGVLGPSSVGKTSLCKVLLGVWPAAAGEIRIDGALISQWQSEDLGKYIGYMPQEPELFQTTVAQNISRLMDVDSQKVVKAAQKAGVHEMILKLPQGYDTKIDVFGKNLSAGQRQLISLARVLYGDPKLVILDEPHTYLDELGLRMLAKAMDSMKQDKITAVVVTDRSNFLMAMDKLLVIKEGQVGMYGPSKEVLAQLAQPQQPQQAAGV